MAVVCTLASLAGIAFVLMEAYRGVAKTISKEERDECWRRCEVHRKWLLSKVFSVESKDSMKIMILPIEAGKPNYRDSPEP